MVVYLLSAKEKLNEKEIKPFSKIGIPTRCSYQKIKLPHRKTNLGFRAQPYSGPSIWNKLDKSLKISVSLNAFKHNLKDHYFRKDNKRVKSDRYNETIISIHSMQCIINFILINHILIYLFLLVFDICYCKIFDLFLIFSFLKETTKKVSLFQLFLCHPGHNFLYI